ncbi:hypothetical protein SLEP1_g5127 [Rubroshorea leprosula]|uniref:Photosystem II protein D2 n=1 Tax=Rubroshorea leprosula TaxID=152421 RepID=A0AAV5HXC1_9ROSI|nr:hypothetical protein SLEP1_g5127 [Rubroshorea leprosula]
MNNPLFNSLTIQQLDLRWVRVGVKFWDDLGTFDKTDV